jgi:N-acetylmuramoyl-L-alanine amidase
MVAHLRIERAAKLPVLLLAALIGTPVVLGTAFALAVTPLCAKPATSLRQVAQRSPDAGVPLPRRRPADPTIQRPSSRTAPEAGQIPLTDAGRLIASAQAGRYDVPRVELAARLAAAGFEATDEYKLMRENAARELTGRPDGVGDVSADDLKKADEAIMRQIILFRGTTPQPSFAELAKLPGRPQIPGLNIVYLNPLGDPADANDWKHIIAHQTEGPAGSARRAATEQFANPTKRGVTIWVEADGTVYWSTAENAIPTHGDGANRKDNKYIDNSKTYGKVVKTDSIGAEFVGNYPNVAKPVTSQQMQAWLVLVRFLQERYGISAENVYAHNWIDMKDHRYCEGCELGTRARSLGYVPSRNLVKSAD